MSESRSRGTRLSATVSSYSCCFFGPPSVYGCGIEGVQYLCVGVYRTCLRTWRYLVQYLLVSYTTWITQVSTTSTLLPPVSIPGHHRSVPWSPAVSIPGHHRSVSLVTTGQYFWSLAVSYWSAVSLQVLLHGTRSHGQQTHRYHLCTYHELCRVHIDMSGSLMLTRATLCYC